MSRLIVMFAVAAVLSAVSADARDTVSFKKLPKDRVEIRIGEAVFGIYNHGKQWNKPFLFPMYAAGGQNVLRDIIPTKEEQGSSKDGTDHFHHKGVWISVDSVNDEKLNFWHEGDKIVNDSVHYVANDDGTGTLEVSNTWIEGDKPLVKEHTTITIYPFRMMAYTINLKAVDKNVTFHDTKEGFFAVRLAHTMREMQGGHITNADGLKGEKDCWGKPTAWIDYYGEVDGKTTGVTLMDHPDNFRESRYHVRSYGLFAISPFGPKKYSNGAEQEAPVVLVPGTEGISLKYALLVHDGDTAAGNVENTYQHFVHSTR